MISYFEFLINYIIIRQNIKKWLMKKEIDKIWFLYRHV